MTFDIKMVSVITPCYNSAAFLPQAIESVLAQTYTDWEMLIVDDCSTDNSADIIQQYARKDGRIRYLRTEKPSGSPTFPRNLGIKSARGRYMAFLDSDDIWLPGKLEAQLAVLEKHPDTGLCFSNYEKISEQGKRNGRVVKAPATVDYKQLLSGNVIGCLTALYDTQKTGKVYFPDHRHEDYLLWLSILKKGGLARNTGTVEALYRVRSHSVSSNKLKTLAWQWDIYLNVEHTGYAKAVWYFARYACKAFAKILK